MGLRLVEPQIMYLQRCDAGTAVLLCTLGRRLSLALRLEQPLLERLCGFPAALLPLLQAHKLRLQSPRPGRRLAIQTKVLTALFFLIF